MLPRGRSTLWLVECAEFRAGRPCPGSSLSPLGLTVDRCPLGPSLLPRVVDPYVPAHRGDAAASPAPFADIGQHAPCAVSLEDRSTGLLVASTGPRRPHRCNRRRQRSTQNWPSFGSIRIPSEVPRCGGRQCPHCSSSARGRRIGQSFAVMGFATLARPTARPKAQSLTVPNPLRHARPWRQSDESGQPVRVLVTWCSSSGRDIARTPLSAKPPAALRTSGERPTA